MTQSVAVVLVTYNRKELLAECLRALRKQTRSVDKIVLVDNASSDGTREMLKDSGFLDDETVNYVRLEQNLGGAGGFHEGMKIAHAAGYDWLWLMDDDTEPHVDALARMESHFGDESVSGIANLQVDRQGIPQLSHRGWVRLCRPDSNLLRPIQASDTEGGPIEIDHASFVGLAVRASTATKIGYPRREFFIHYDDFEYCLRIKQVGRVLLVPDSVIIHKEASTANSTTSHGARRRMEPVNKLWLTYYGTRNLVWIRRRYCGLAPALLTGSRKLLGTLFFDDLKYLRLRLETSATFDGIVGRFDNTKPRRLMSRWMSHRRKPPSTL